MQGEARLERAVSEYIGNMTFLWISILDPPGPNSLRRNIEVGAISLLSNYAREAIDPASKSWLGRYSPSDKVRGSGLWNSNHVDESLDPNFLDTLEKTILATSILGS